MDNVKDEVVSSTGEIMDTIKESGLAGSWEILETEKETEIIRNFEKKINEHGLDVQYWKLVLKDHLGIININQLQFCSSSSIDKLRRKIRFPWEESALQKLFEISEGEDNAYQEERIKVLKQKKRDAENLIKELKTFHEDGKQKVIELSGKKCEDLRKVLEVQDQNWIKNHTELSISEIETQLEEKIGDLNHLVRDRKKLTATETLANASAGLALRGILLSKNSDEISQLRKTVLEIPKEARLMGPVLQQREDIVEHSSKEQSDIFHRSLDNMGYSFAVSIKGGTGLLRNVLPVLGEASFNKKCDKEKRNERESHYHNVFMSRVSLSVIPTASCELHVNSMRISDEAVSELKEIEEHLNSANESSILDRCGQFFRKFGSHVNSGIIHFGGIYKCVTTYSGETKSDEKKIQTLVENAHSCKISGYAGFGVDVSGHIGGDHFRGNASLSGQFDSTEDSKIQYYSTRVGGPQEVSTLKLWKEGLQMHNDTWAIIDRGNMSDQDVCGIWELIPNHNQDFANSEKLGSIMYHAWTIMKGTGDYTVFQKMLTTVKIEHVIKKIGSWIEDENFALNINGYLRKLYDELENVKADDIDMLEAEITKQVSLPAFCNLLVENSNKYSNDQLPLIKYLLEKLLYESHLSKIDFPYKERTMEWLHDSLCPTINFEKRKKIETVEDLLKLIASYVKSFEGQLEVEPISININTELALDVWSLIKHLTRKKQQYDLFFFKTVLHKLPYSEISQYFTLPLSYEILLDFQQRLMKELKAFREYSCKEDHTKIQAYLIDLAISILIANKDPQEEERYFDEQIPLLSSAYTPELKQVLEKYTKESPYQWQTLRIAMKAIMKGQKDFLQQPLIRLERFESCVLLGNSEPNCKTHNRLSNAHSKDFGLHLDYLGLRKYFPSKLSNQYIMSPRKESLQRSPYDLPFNILRRIIMLDFRAREDEVSKVIDTEQDNVGKTFLDDLYEEIESIKGPLLELNPLDVFLVIFCCCDMMLQQIIIQKLFQCRLAIPFILPKFSTEKLYLNLWSLRTIVPECIISDQSVLNSSVVRQSCEIVSVIRLGSISQSKSKLINTILSDTTQMHEVFFNKDCPQGMTSKTLSDGLIEAAWYIPLGNASDAFRIFTMFLNLRGDALCYTDQVQILEQLSSVIVVLLDVNNIASSETLTFLKSMYDRGVSVLLCLSSKGPPNKKLFQNLMDKAIQNCGKENLSGKNSIIPTFIPQTCIEKNVVDLKNEIRICIFNMLNGMKGKSLESRIKLIDTACLKIDEDDNECQEGKQLAEEVLTIVKENGINTVKKEKLPMQGQLLLEWNTLFRKQHKTGGKRKENISYYQIAKWGRDMEEIRQKQIELWDYPLPLIETFIKNFTKCVYDDRTVSFFLQWLRLYLDDESRRCLPGAHQNYYTLWQELKKVKNQSVVLNPQMLQKLKAEVFEAEIKLAEASFGLEHLFREVGQIYEALSANYDKLHAQTQAKIDCFPKVVAKLLLSGEPLEIMDGDVCCVPLAWIKAILMNTREIVGDKKVFVLSVLGIQSSGKSTLLNTMFGFQFKVSAGRCTRGIFIQLLKVDKESNSLPFDYVLVIDTEGLRAPELAQQKYDHDNELATLAIGLADVTFMNIKGDNMAEVKDVLQIVVHAFLRMKIVNSKIKLYRSCIFIHQNVQPFSDKAKLLHGLQKMQDNLDLMTAEAAEGENIANVNAFNHVIYFDAEKHVWYVPSLWNGHYEYGQCIAEVRSCLFGDIVQNQRTFIKFSELAMRIDDLWKGVVADDFVYSFRNSLAAKAYNNMESEFYKLDWLLTEHVFAWIDRSAKLEIEQCHTEEGLNELEVHLKNDLAKIVNMKTKELEKHLDEFFETSNMSEIMIQWKTGTILSLRHNAEEKIQQGKKYINQYKYAQNINNKLKSKQGLEKEILDKAKQFAETLKGELTSDDQLELTFNNSWLIWIQDIVSKITDQKINIPLAVETELNSRWRKDRNLIRKELDMHPIAEFVYLRTNSYDGIFDDISQYISIKTNFYQRNVDTLEIMCIKKAQQITTNIIDMADVFLNDLISRETNFQLIHVTELVNKIESYIEDHNMMTSQKYPFTLLPNFRIKLVVHICSYAIKFFKVMQDEYEKRHGPVAKLESYKNTVWNMFKHTFKQSADEVIAANLFCDSIEETIRKEIKQAISRQIIEDTLNHFAMTKFHLILEILDDLAKKGNFEHFQQYITDAKTYGWKWLISYINEKYFMTQNNSTSEYARQASSKAKEIFKTIEESINKATKKATSTQDTSVHNWVREFCRSAKARLLIPNTEMDLLADQKVSDYNNFQRLILAHLPELEKNITQSFQLETVATVKWEGNTSPYEEVIERLWGCEAQCPFCMEPCQHTDPNHLTKGESHRCIQHRPMGIGWVCYGSGPKERQLVIESCNFNIQQQNEEFTCSACDNQCRKSGKCNTRGFEFEPHKYLEYKTYLPEWDIQPNASMDSSEYWMWFMANYKHQLKEIHGCKVPNVPPTWNNISLEKARQSLRRADS